MSLPTPSITYRGTYKFSIEISGVGRVYLSHGESALTTNADSRTTFALYEIENTNPKLMSLKSIGESVGTNGRWFGLNGARVPEHDDVYPTVSWTQGDAGATMFRCSIQNGTAKLLIPYFRAALTVQGNRFWMVAENSFYAQTPWTVTAIHEWSNDQSGADLRWVDFTKRQINGVTLNNANLKSTDFFSAAVLSSHLRGADFTNAMLAQASFSWTRYGQAAWDTDLSGAVFKGASLINTAFDGCNLTDADFRDAIASSPYLPTASFRDAVLVGAKFGPLTAPNKPDLRNVDFTGANLTGAQLVDANLQGAKFKNAILTDASLAGADLKGADFTNAILLRTKFNNATLDGNTRFLGARMMGATFQSCNLLTAQFSDPPSFYEGTLSPPTERNPLTNLQGATVSLNLIKRDWTWLNLSGATINGTLPADLSDFKAKYTVFPKDLNLQERKLDGASFHYATLHGVQLQKSTAMGRPVDFSNADLTDAKMSFVQMDDAKFDGAWLTGVIMANASLDGAQFDGAHLDKKDGKTTDLSSSSLMNANFTNAYLSDANLTYVMLWGSTAKIAGATVQRTRFDNAYLGNLDFQNVAQQKLEDASFTGAFLVNAKFNGTALRGVSLSGACLQGANFTDASLVGARMNNAAIWTNTTQGTITISGNDSLPASATFTRTQIASEATNVTTTCPNGDVGPCSNDKWSGASAPMTSWKWGP